jgi:hypothetical protein
LATEFASTALVTAGTGASTQIRTVLGFWDHLESDLTHLVADIDAILSDVSDPASIDQSISEIQNAQSSWSDVEDFMQVSKILGTRCGKLERFRDRLQSRSEC